MKTDHFPSDVGIPIYGLDFLSNDVIVVGGGGGSSRSGVKNKIIVYELNRLESKLNLKFEIDLSKDEDAPMVLASSEKHKAILAGINATETSIKAGENKDLRLFNFNESEIKFSKSVNTISSKSADDHEKVIAMSTEYDSIAVGSSDGSLAVLDFPSLKKRFASGGFKDDVYDADFAEEGDMLAATSAKEVLVLDSKTGKTVQNIERPTLLGKDDPCSFRAGRYGRGSTAGFFYTVVNARSRTKSFIVKWDAKTWKRLGMRVVARKSITTFDRSADGNLLAFATADYTISINDAKTLRSLITIPKAHGFAITALKFNKDSSALVSGSVDTSLRVIKVPPSFSSSFNTIIIVIFALLFVLIGVGVQLYLIRDIVSK